MHKIRIWGQYIRKRCALRQVNAGGGFTLLEVVVSMMILAIGLVGLAALQVLAIQGNTFGHQMSYATGLAQQTFEQLETCAFDDAAIDQSTNPHTQTVVSEQGVTYTVTWNVQDDTPGADMKSVALEVTWQSARPGPDTETPGQREVKAAFTRVLAR